jgi:hypothetical protein
MNRRIFGLVIAAVAALALVAAPVLAANPHIVGSLTTAAGPGSNQVTVTGKIAGLGGGYTGTDLSGTADATFDIQCSNKPGHLAPGQQGATASLTGEGAIDSVDSGGNYHFSITFTIGPLTPAKAFGCPNNQWTASPVNVEVTLTSLTLEDGTVIDL